MVRHGIVITTLPPTCLPKREIFGSKGTRCNALKRKREEEGERGTILGAGVCVFWRQDGHDLYGLRPLSGIQKQGGSILLSYTGNHGDNPYKGCPCSFCRTRVSSSQVAATPTTTRVLRMVLRARYNLTEKLLSPLTSAVYNAIR